MHPLRLARYHIRQCKLLSYTAKHQIPNLFSYIAYDFSASSYKSRNGTTVKYLPLSYFNVSLSLTFTIFLCSINFRWPQSTPNQVREFQITKPKKKKKLRLCLNNWFEFELVWQWWSSWAVSRCYRGYQARLSGKSPKLSLSNAMVWVLLFHFSLLLLLLARNCSYKLKRLFIYLL